MSAPPIKSLRRRISSVRVSSNAEYMRVKVYWQPGWAFDPEGDGKRYAGLFTRMATASLLESLLNAQLRAVPNGYAGIPAQRT